MKRRKSKATYNCARANKKLHLSREFAAIGIMLLVLSVPVGTWVFAQEFRIAHIFHWAQLILITAGLVLYSVGRNAFWRWMRKYQAVSILLLLFGAFMFFYGGYIGFWSLDGIKFYLSYSSPINENAVQTYMLTLGWASLWSIVGILFFVEGLLHPRPTGVVGVIIAGISFVIFWNLTLFEAHTGGRLGLGFASFFLGYSLYLAVSVVLVLLVVTGIIVFVSSLRKKALTPAMNFEKQMKILRLVLCHSLAERSSQ
jgi:hypothetical protein